MAVILLHGETDWARNVIAAGEATLRYRRTTARLRNPRILHPREASTDVAGLARLANRIAGIFVFRSDDNTARARRLKRNNLDELTTMAEVEHGPVGDEDVQALRNRLWSARRGGDNTA